MVQLHQLSLGDTFDGLLVEVSTGPTVQMQEQPGRRCYWAMRRSAGATQPCTTKTLHVGNVAMNPAADALHSTPHA